MLNIKISVFCPTFNSQKFIGYAIASMLDNVDEVIIVDSGSTDNTLKILDWFEKPISYQQHIDFFDQHLEVGALSVLARSLVMTKQTTRVFSDKRLRYCDKWGYMDIRPGPIPWHFILTKALTLRGLMNSEKIEMCDTLLVDFIRKRLKKRFLTLDCRDISVHFDGVSTVKKYPVFEVLRQRRHFRKTHQRTVTSEDIREA